MPQKMILFVCSGNTCRSPMAKALLQHKLEALGRSSDFVVDSAAAGWPTYATATEGAREAIRTLCGKDLLAGHKPKSLDPSLIRRADLILTMTAGLKSGLPPGKTWTLKEFAGGTGDISDPIGSDLQVYLAVAGEISSALDKVIARL